MFRNTNITKLLQELQEAVDINEDIVEVPQTMKPQEDAEVETPDDMEDIEKEDFDKLDVTKKKDRKDVMKEVPDKELEVVPQESRKIIKGNLYLCKECTKTFENKEPVCSLCKSKEVELLVEGYKERGKRDGTGPHKDSAQRSISDKGKRKQKGEKCPFEVEEDYRQVTPGKYEITFYDGSTERLVANSKVDAMNRIKRGFPGKNIQSAELVKQISPTRIEQGVAVEGKVCADKDSEETKIKKLTETVQELIGEVPGIDLIDQHLLNKAIENEVIPNQFPELEVMIDELSAADVAKDLGVKDIDDVDLGDIDAVYLKYVLLPKAKEAFRVARESKKANKSFRVWYKDPSQAQLVKMKHEFRALTSQDAEKAARKLLDKEAPGNEFEIAKSELMEESKLKEQREIDRQVDLGMGLLSKYNDDVTKVMDYLMSSPDRSPLEQEEWEQVEQQIQNFVDSLEESKLKEQEVEDNYTTIARGIKDKDVADKLAAEKNGMVITDEEDKDKFTVIVKESKIREDARSVVIDAFYPHGYHLSSESIDKDTGIRTLVLTKGDENLEVKVMPTKEDENERTS